ncbi:MAG: type II secretion system F family protein [Actinomycetales bacterium]|nr:type II secretion system F family protein [Actinomycetales bacterium]
MSGALAGAAIGATFGLGAVVAVTGYRAVRTPSLSMRVLPYVRDLASVSGRPAKSSELTDALVEKLASAQRTVAETVSGTAGVERRLLNSGSADSVADFRARQWSSGVIGFALASALGLVLWGVYQFTALGILGLSFAGFVGGMYWCDVRLTAAVSRYEAQMAREFPVVADLLALSVAAGESPLAAVQRVVLVSHGPLSKELAKLVAQVRSGGTTADAFEALSKRVGVLSVSRFAATMAVAIERGTPLISVLHAQAADAREASRRTLIESAGRREILMLMPVVFLVLPTVIVFAFYPGMIALTFVSG